MIALTEVVRRTGAARVGAMLGLGFVVAASLQAQSAKVPTVANQAKVGAGLYEVVVSESTNSIYVASTGANDPKIIELDATTLAEKRSISTAGAVAFGLGINNHTQMIYTTNTRAGNVSAIDLRKGEIVATIKVDADPSAHVFRALVDEESNTVYVSVVATPSQVWVIDGATNTLKHIIENTGARSTGLALDRKNNRLFTASQSTHEVQVIDLASRKVTNVYASGGQRPSQMVFDPATNRLFVTHQTTNNVAVIDTTTGTVIKAIATGNVALGIGLDMRANLLYVANRGGGNVTVIDAGTLAVVATLDAGTMPNTVAIDARNGDVYVTNKARPAGRGGRGARAGGAPAAGAGAPVAAAPPSAPAPAAPPDEGGDTVTRLTLPR